MFYAPNATPDRIARLPLFAAAFLSLGMLLFPPFTGLAGTEYAFALTGPEWSRTAVGLDLGAQVHWGLLLVQLAAVWALALAAKQLLARRPSARSSLLLCSLVVACVLVPEASAQGFFDRVKEAAGRAVQSAGEAARSTFVEEGMQEATFLMMQDGQFGGTATPWFAADGSAPVAFADLPGQAFASTSTIAFLFCQGPNALDAILLQGDFAAAADGPQDYFLADNAFSVALVRDGRTYPLRNTATRPGAVSAGILTLEPTESGGFQGSLDLTIDEGPGAGRRALVELFQRSRIVELNGSFRAAPAQSIEGVTCDG